MSELDTSALGKLAAAGMEQISKRFDADAYVRTIALVVEVDTGDDTTMCVACSDDRPWFQVAFLREASLTLADRMEFTQAEDDE